MSRIWSADCVYYPKGFDLESELERIVKDRRDQIFGPMGIYLDAKKRLGSAGGPQRIPDGFLLDLNSDKPRLYFVELELHRHPHRDHIVSQVLSFLDAFRSDQYGLKAALADFIGRTPKANGKCKAYAKAHKMRNSDHLLDTVIHDKDPGIGVVVIIDEMSSRLEAHLSRDLNLDVRVLVVARYQNKQGDILYQYDPFHDTSEWDCDIEMPSAVRRDRSPSYVEDTVIVRLDERSLQESFLSEKHTQPIAIQGTKRQNIKWIAAFRAGPIPAITHVAKVTAMELSGEPGKYVVKFSEPLRSFRPVKLLQGSKETAPVTVRYANYKRLRNAHAYDEVWNTVSADSSDLIHVI